jgi:hypothetical protein
VTEGPSDLEASLAEIDRKLRGLQAELQVFAGGPGESEASPAEAPVAPSAPPASPPAGPSAPVDDLAERVTELSRRIDELQRLGEQLEAATKVLHDEFARGAAAPPPPPAGATWTGEVVIRAGPFPDIASLGEFERALGDVAGAEQAFVRSFAGDRALVEVRLTGEVDLVAEMERALPWEVRVLESGPGELEIALGP